MWLRQLPYSLNFKRKRTHLIFSLVSQHVHLELDEYDTYNILDYMLGFEVNLGKMIRRLTNSYGTIPYAFKEKGGRYVSEGTKAYGMHGYHSEY